MMTQHTYHRVNFDNTFIKTKNTEQNMYIQHFVKGVIEVHTYTHAELRPNVRITKLIQHRIRITS